MNLTDFHAKYFAYELTKRSPSDSVEMLAGVLADAQVDLNPHQIEAALFAFRNPFSRGAILADEVGLGKTIEAGLLLAQRRAERKRKLLVILPANFRKQWNQELADKFYLPSMIMETRSFNEAIRRRKSQSVFSERDCIVLLSVCAKQRAVPSSSCVGFGCHRRSPPISKRLQNFQPHRAGDQAGGQFISKDIADGDAAQNSLLELYGLVSIIDDYAFGDLKSFRAKFARLGNQADFAELKERLSLYASGPCAARCSNMFLTQTVMPSCRNSCPRRMSKSSTTLYPIISSDRRSTRCPPGSAN